MAISMFSSQVSPIAFDFGSSSLKMLQVGPGEPSPLLAAAELSVPEELRADQNGRLEFFAEKLPRLLKRAKFKGRRAVCSIPSAQTFVQHMQIPVNSENRDDVLRGQLQLQMGWAPSSVVVRSVEVAEVYRNGQPKTEIICFAILRDMVMRHVELLKRCKLDVSSVHTEQHAMTWAFDHLHRRDGDDKLTELYVDLGWGSTKVAISHGRQLVFSKSIQIGGRNFDQLIAESLHCDSATARSHRLALGADGHANGVGREVAATSVATAEAPSMEAGLPNAEEAIPSGDSNGGNRRSGAMPAALATEIEPGPGPATPGEVDFSEFLEAITDELQMCRRYHRMLFPDRQIDRVIFLGGESKQVGFCRAIAKSLEVPARLGDPMARLRRDDPCIVVGPSFDEPQPGWAVVFGLCCGSDQ